MTDPGKILERIRSHGANVMLDRDRLVVVNRGKLPAGAMDYIKAHGKQIAAFLSDEADIEERAAIIEHDGGAPREMAEAFAQQLADMAKRTGWPEPDRAWFIGVCAKNIDAAADLAAGLRRAA